MRPTPETDARTSQITVQSEDEYCSVEVTLNGEKYDGDIVDADFARNLERQRDELLEALDNLAHDKPSDHALDHHLTFEKYARHTARAAIANVKGVKP